MDNSHGYPSEYTFRFGERTDHPATHHAVADKPRRRHADWPVLLGTAFAHREACLETGWRCFRTVLSSDVGGQLGIKPCR